MPLLSLGHPKGRFLHDISFLGSEWAFCAVLAAARKIKQRGELCTPLSASQNDLVALRVSPTLRQPLLAEFICNA